MYDFGKISGLAGLALGAWLAVLIVRSRLHWRYPFFLSYVASTVPIGVIRFATLSHPWPYFVAYWATEAVYTVLAVLALHEIFRRVFFGFYAQFLWFRLLFPSVVALATSFVVWRGLQSPAIQVPPLLRFILLFGIAGNFIQMGLLCMFLLVAAFYRMRWRQVPLGISLGFAIAATGALAGYWLRSEFGTTAILIATYVPPVAYLLGVAIWLLTFLKLEPEPSWADATANLGAEAAALSLREHSAALPPQKD